MPVAVEVCVYFGLGAAVGKVAAIIKARHIEVVETAIANRLAEVNTM